MTIYFKILSTLITVSILLSFGCNQDQKPVTKPVDSTKVFMYDTLLTNSSQPGGYGAIIKMNLRGDTIDVWSKSLNANGTLISRLKHFNLDHQLVYSVDSVFNRDNKIPFQSISIFILMITAILLRL